MAFELSPEEIRVVGALIEKEATTPDYYPLTLNALVSACNQKSSRDPVVQYDDHIVQKALDQLRDRRFAWTVSGGGRVPKFEHNLADALNLSVQELALLSVLLLRGAQTVGELRSRSYRAYPFEELTEVEVVLDTLMERAEPLVARLPVQPGRKEARFMHLLGGDVDTEALAASAVAPTPAVSAGAASADHQRIERLESEITSLWDEIAQLREQLDAFRAEFE